MRRLSEAAPEDERMWASASPSCHPIYRWKMIVDVVVVVVVVKERMKRTKGLGSFQKMTSRIVFQNQDFVVVVVVINIAFVAAAAAASAVVVVDIVVD